ncbi:MAG: YggS family pyridoxal phosphate enzyme, partial [Ignavibacteria bacterium]
MQKMQSIAERWKRIEHEVQDAALSCGRNPHDITIVAVSKMHSLEYVQQAYDAGARVFGENYAQEF